ncbi:hypothetical protein BD779DRAFT_1479344 [Infundibulicybe gibba]|nr:hypothetical protein BD779DRAFT_1479344 [Infundibulicybe gibba]
MALGWLRPVEFTWNHTNEAHHGDRDMVSMGLGMTGQLADVVVGAKGNSNQQAVDPVPINMGEGAVTQKHRGILREGYKHTERQKDVPVIRVNSGIRIREACHGVWA